MVKDIARSVSSLQPFYDGSKDPTHLALNRGGRTLCGLLAEKRSDLATFNAQPCTQCTAAALADG